MNREGGCCIANYGVGGGERMYGMSQVDRIMLKYRPIAPKPVAAGSGSGGSSDGYVKCERSKRKYVKVKKNKNECFKRRGTGEKMKVKVKASPPVVTLPLLPETPDRKENQPVNGVSDLVSLAQTTKSDNNNNNNSNSNSSNSNSGNNSDSNSNKKLEVGPVWLCFSNQEQDGVKTVVMKPKPKPAPRVPLVVSYVTVECVTDTWVDSEVLGCTDEEIVKNMDKDTCPAFITDGQDKVVWTNKSYRDMAGVGHVVGEDDIAVVLVRKDKWTRSPVTYPAFTCKVRVTFGSYNRPQSLSSCCHTLTLPCDVWKMGRGASVWRLDVKAALSLGR